MPMNMAPAARARARVVTMVVLMSAVLARREDGVTVLLSKSYAEKNICIYKKWQEGHIQICE